MNVFKIAVFSLFCTTAFAGLDTPFENYEGGLQQAPYTRVHVQDENAPRRGADPVAVYGIRNPGMVMFHEYDQTVLPKVVLTGALDKKKIPSKVAKKLKKLKLTTERLHVVCQAANGKELLRPQYYSRYKAPRTSKGKVDQGNIIRWMALGGNWGDKLNPKHTNKAKLFHEGRMNFHNGPKYFDVRASGKNGKVKLLDKNGNFSPHSFFTIVKIGRSKAAAVTLHILVPMEIANYLEQIFTHTNNLRDAFGVITTTNETLPVVDAFQELIAVETSLDTVDADAECLQLATRLSRAAQANLQRIPDYKKDSLTEQEQLAIAQINSLADVPQPAGGVRVVTRDSREEPREQEIDSGAIERAQASVEGAEAAYYVAMQDNAHVAEAFANLQQARTILDSLYAQRTATAVVDEDDAASPWERELFNEPSEDKPLLYAEQEDRSRMIERAQIALEDARTTHLFTLQEQLNTPGPAADAQVKSALDNLENAQAILESLCNS